jgi:hypothetical protein
VDYVFKPQAVVTGTSVQEAKDDAPASPFATLDKPVVVFVSHPGGGGDDYDKLEKIVFKDEKVGLSVKAFRRVMISPEKLERDPILADEGTEVPRLLVIDPIKEKVIVLEKSKLKAGTFVKAMEKAAKHFYEERLDKVVKEHLKLLTEQDQLSNEEKTLQSKEGRLAEEGDKNEKKLAEVREELAAVRKQQEELKQKQADLWKLTPRERASA